MQVKKRITTLSKNSLCVRVAHRVVINEKNRDTGKLYLSTYDAVRDEKLPVRCYREEIIDKLQEKLIEFQNNGECVLCWDGNMQSNEEDRIEQFHFNSNTTDISKRDYDVNTTK